MAVRKTYQFNCLQTNQGDGLILNQLADMKGRRTNYALPFLLDLNGQNRALLGDTIAGGRGGIALPAEVPGGWFLGGLKSLTSADSPYTVQDDDTVLLCNTGGGNITVNLPAVASNPGRKLYIKKTAEGNLLTLDGNGTETIDNETTLVIGTDGGDFDRAVQIWSNGSTGWEIVTNVTRMRNLLSNFAPAATTTSGSNATIATSASFIFSGRDVMFFLNGNMRNNNGSNEYMQVAFALRFDAGTSIDICEWNSNLADNHQAFAGCLIMNPSAGARTVDLRWRRISGAGTATFDGNDFYTLNMIEL